MKKLLTSFLIILLIFASCKNPDLVEYIEKGFAKPAVEDVRFNESSLGNENKIYVPSNRDIEIELTIKNKYEKEITGTLEFAKDKKDLFGTAPYIKSLTATKMVVAFKFKEEAEPQATNDFLGASIPLNLKIYEKKTARFLSSQTIEANCNTAPLPIAKDKIVYNQEKDEYSVTLPKKTGKNNDLKNVEFSLSSMFSNEAVSSRIVPITEENEQNIKLKVKGEEDWQLKNPSGDRTLKAVVYDKAGLNSSSQNTSKRKFTSITLEPSSVEIDKASAIADGFSVPKIKELVDYFREEKNWIAAGYNVEYLTNDFERISSQTPQVFKPKDPGLLTAGNYEILVKLSGGGNELTKKYPVAIMGSDEAGINTDKLKITDETTYKSSELKIEIGSLNFTNDGTDAKKCDVAIPYTDINTNLKVHVEALGEGTIRTSELDPNKAKKRDFNIELEKNSESEKTLIFYAYAPDNHTNIKYTIKFNRKASIYAAVALKSELLQSKNCTVKMIWKYGEKTIFTTDDGSAKNDGLRVATGESIKFEVTAGVGHKIKECSSNNHSPITIDNDKKLIFNLSANADFTLSVTFTAEASFKWCHQQSDFVTSGYTWTIYQSNFLVKQEIKKILKFFLFLSIGCSLKITLFTSPAILLYKKNKSLGFCITLKL